MSTDAAYLEKIFASWRESCLKVSSDNFLDSKKEELLVEAKNLFEKTSDNSKASSLAKLLRDLGPSLLGSLPSRICSLSVVLGALKACQSSPLTIATSNLLCKFFLEQCLPIKDDYGEEDYADQVRDLAITCLSTLLRCQIQTGNDSQQVLEACQLICSSARQGVEQRCALPEDDDDARYLSGVTGGLSTLPRSRRSNCFDLLQAATDSISNIVATISQAQLPDIGKKMEADLASYATFVCQCLQGESDPRCLMQLLVLFHNIQLACEPFFSSAKLDSFPTVAMFDAVAPYYPINFTPPLHDNHGITRAGLRAALMSVLSCFQYDALAASKNKDTMMNLSLGLVMERLIPLDGDDSNLATTPIDKKDALNDLESILFPADDKPILDLLPKGSAQQLSNALSINHYEAAVAVNMGGTDVNDNKTLADFCRRLVARIANELETSKNQSSWEEFVKHPVADMVSKLDTAGPVGRVAIAYLASLVASGGPQTTRLVLEAGLDKSVAILKNYTEDPEVATMAAFGVGAFFSSCNVAVEKANATGLRLHPHPVANMSSITFRILNKIYNDPKTNVFSSLRHATVVALESVLIVSPSNEFNSDDETQICQLILQLSSDVLEATDASEPFKDKSCLDQVTASAKALGGLIGKSFQSYSEDSSDGITAEDSVLSKEAIRDIIRNKVMVDLLYRCKKESLCSMNPRLDRVALARACSSAIGSSKVIIDSLLHTLRDNLLAHSVGQSRECAAALCQILRNGGGVAARAYHELDSSGVSPQDVIEKLCDLDPRRERSKDSHSDKSVSPLDLPATIEEKRKLQQIRQEIASMMLPAYKECVPTEEIIRAMSSVAKILPPLSERDEIRLSIQLPLLAEALEHGGLPSQDHPAIAGFESIRSDLATYALNTHYDAGSRSAASSCLFSHIAHLTKKELEFCPAKLLFEDVVIPALAEASEELGKKHDSGGNAEEKVIDCLNLGSVLAYAAASRGGNSVATADSVAAFLVELACSQKSTISFDSSLEISLKQVEYTSICTAVTISAAGAFGSLLCGAKPLWIQRVTHKTLKNLEPSMKLALESVSMGTAELGLITVLCHVVCVGTLKSANLAKRGEIVKLLVSCLISGILTGKEVSTIPNEISKVKRLVSASFLKLCHTSPGLLSTYTEKVVMGLLRLYGGNTIESNPFSDVACKLLILQVMERLCHIEIRKKTLLTLRPAITSLLGAAMNHPSRLLREAAVTVRNTWYTLPS